MTNLIKKYKGLIFIFAVVSTLLVCGYVQTKNASNNNVQKNIKNNADKKVSTSSVTKTDNKPIKLEELRKLLDKDKSVVKAPRKKHYSNYRYDKANTYYTHEYRNENKYQSILKDLKPKHSNYYDNSKIYNDKNTSSNNNDYTWTGNNYIPKSSSDVYVHGYYKRNGTYVEPYYRTKGDNTTKNNFSHNGNVNPYTGKVGQSKK